jgi:hypothetical protein
MCLLQGCDFVCEFLVHSFVLRSVHGPDRWRRSAEVVSFLCCRVPLCSYPCDPWFASVFVCEVDVWELSSSVDESVDVCACQVLSYPVWFPGEPSVESYSLFFTMSARC